MLWHGIKILHQSINVYYTNLGQTPVTDKAWREYSYQVTLWKMHSEKILWGVTGWMVMTGIQNSLTCLDLLESPIFHQYPTHLQNQVHAAVISNRFVHASEKGFRSLC